MAEKSVPPLERSTGERDKAFPLTETGILGKLAKEKSGRMKSESEKKGNHRLKAKTGESEPLSEEGVWKGGKNSPQVFG